MSTKQRVSICVPTYNTLPFLEQRFETIFRQTLQDWELFVFDSYSDDGSWEFIRDMANRERRMRIVQGPRKGPYPAWNECLRQTTGEYVYIATSDDTMAEDCLERMVCALDRNPDCEIAHCPLVLIDRNGESLDGQGWLEVTAFARGMGELAHKRHLRRAPYDGLLHLTGRHAYLSVTQLLIRRSLFTRIGDFPDRWGSVSDFNWEMKAGLVANTIHVPDTWATLRIHSQQVSASIDVCSTDHFLKFEEMIQEALAECEEHIPTAVAAVLKSHLLKTAREMRTYYAGLRQRRDSAVRRRLFQLSQLFRGSKAVRSEIIGRFLGKAKWPDTIPAELQHWLEATGSPPLIPC